MARAQVDTLSPHLKPTSARARAARDRDSARALDHACDRIADMLSVNSAPFDRARFLHAARRTKI